MEHHSAEDMAVGRIGHSSRSRQNRSTDLIGALWICGAVGLSKGPRFTMSPRSIETTGDRDHSACRRHSPRAGASLRCAGRCDRVGKHSSGSTVQSAKQGPDAVPSCDGRGRPYPTRPGCCHNAGSDSRCHAAPGAVQCSTRVCHRRPCRTRYTIVTRDVW